MYSIPKTTIHQSWLNKKYRHPRTHTPCTNSEIKINGKVTISRRQELLMDSALDYSKNNIMYLRHSSQEEPELKKGHNSDKILDRVSSSWEDGVMIVNNYFKFQSNISDGLGIKWGGSSSSSSNSLDLAV